MTARGKEKTQAWIEAKARPEGGWWVIVCVMRPSRRGTIGKTGERRLIPHVADTWKAYTVPALRKALDAAAALRRRLVS